MIPIKVDFREKNSRIPEVMKMTGLDFTFENLEVGDYIIEDHVPVERKEVSDYVASMTDGRLNNQLYNLSTRSPLSYLFVIGNITDTLIARKMSRQTYYSSLMGSGWKISPDGEHGRVMIYTVETDEDFVLCLKFLREKVINDEPRLLRLQKVRWSDSDRILGMFMSLPNVGPVIADKLARNFGSFHDFANAEIQSMMDVDGFGLKKSKDAYNILRKRYDPAERRGKIA